MKAIILKAKPYSLFRLGSGSLYETDKIIHSDTLFSALVNIHSKIFDDTEKFIEAFDTGDIQISSAFPVLLNSDKKIFFLPKPEFDYDDAEDVKKAKKIKFISLEIFKKINAENLSNFDLIKGNTLLGKTFAVSQGEIENKEKIEIPEFISEVVTAKTKVHYEIQESNFYHETDIQLLPLTIDKQTFVPSYYFFYELNCSPELKNEFFTCLKILPDEGIGGERSTGKGLLEKIIETELNLPLPNNSEQQLLLSLFVPKKQEEFDAVEKYEMLIRGGGSVSFDSEDDSQEEEIKPFRKKQVRMIAEGAIINGEVEGSIVDVSPISRELFEHNFYRNGKSFTIPIG